MNEDPRDNFHIVLVEPENSLNIGSVARAMMNLGFRNLHLVAPSDFDRAKALVTARRADLVLDTLLLHDTLEEALAEMEDVVGLALIEGKLSPHCITLPRWIEHLPGRLARKTALVFGPEGNGLRQEHLRLCRWILRIPSSDDLAAFNLAQSVLLVLYDISRVISSADDTADSTGSSELPTWNDFYRLGEHVEAVMRESGFVRQGTPQQTPGIVRNLLFRLAPDRREMGILLGLFSRLHTTLLRRKSGEDEKVR